MEVMHQVKTAIRRAEQMTEQVLSKHSTEVGRTCPESGRDALVLGNGKRPERGVAGRSMIQWVPVHPRSASEQRPMSRIRGCLPRSYRMIRSNVSIRDPEKEENLARHRPFFYERSEKGIRRMGPHHH